LDSKLKKLTETSPAPALKTVLRPALLPSLVQSAADYSSYAFSLEESLGDLSQFLALQEEAIEFLFSENLNHQAMASKMLSILRALVRRESNVLSFEEGIEVFFSNLWGSSTHKEIMRDLYDELKSFLYGLNLNKGPFILNRARASLWLLLEWYSLRKRNLLLIAEQEANYRFGSDELDRVFDLKIIEDFWQGRSFGLLVSCGLRLHNYLGRTLWLKIHIFHGESPIRCRQSSYSWSEGANSAESSEAPFVALLPIRPESQNLVLDHITCFVPFSELDLSGVSGPVTLRIGVYDENGRALLAWTEERQVSIPELPEPVLNLPSPQAMGLWACDPVLEAQILSFELLPPSEAETANWDFELKLKGMAFRWRELEVQIRFFDKSFEILGTDQLGLKHADGGFVLRETINFAKDDFSIFKKVIRVEGDKLKLLNYDEELFAEVAVLAEHSRVICGAATLVPPTRFKVQSGSRGLAIAGEPASRSGLAARLFSFLKPAES